MTMGSKTGNYGRQTDQTAVLDICIIAGKMPTSWQLVAVVEGPKTAKKNDVQQQTGPKSRETFIETQV